MSDDQHSTAEPVLASACGRRMVYHHPVYCPESLAARRRLKEINGANRTYFAGAYWGYGFHEDGVNSALEVCRHFGKAL